MPKLRRTFSAGGPVLASMIFTAGECSSVEIGTGEHVVLVRVVAASVHDFFLLGKGVLLPKFGILRVQISDILRDHDAFGVVPRAFPDTIAGIHSRLAICRGSAQIS